METIAKRQLYRTVGACVEFVTQYGCHTLSRRRLRPTTTGVSLCHTASRLLDSNSCVFDWSAIRFVFSLSKGPLSNAHRPEWLQVLQTTVGDPERSIKLAFNGRTRWRTVGHAVATDKFFSCPISVDRQLYGGATTWWHRGGNTSGAYTLQQVIRTETAHGAQQWEGFCAAALSSSSRASDANYMHGHQLLRSFVPIFERSRGTSADGRQGVKS